MGSWWWIQYLQDQIDSLFQEKMLQTQSLIRIQERVKDLEQLSEQKKNLITTLEKLNDQEQEKALPVALLNGISRNLKGLEIGLDRIHLEGQIVEMHGQSMGIENIGKFIGELENDQMIVNVPIVEIFDPPKGEAEVFPFMIRFAFNRNVTT